MSKLSSSTIFNDQKVTSNPDFKVMILPTSNNSKMERDRAIVFIDRQTDRQTHVSHVSYILSKSSKRIYCILNLCKAGVPTRDIVYILLFSY